MEAPTLLKSQLNKSLNKKKVVKASIRNVLSRATTFKWPEITKEQSERIFEELRKYLTHEPVQKINYKFIKDVKKEKRKEFRNELRSKTKRPEMMNHIVLGLNSIIKALENKEIICILVSSDVDPKQMVKFLCYHSEQLKIPVLVVPELRNELNNIIKFPSLAIAIKTLPPKNDLHEIYRYIRTLHGKFIDNIVQDDKNDISTVIKSIDSHSTSKIIDSDDKNSKCVYLYRFGSDRIFQPTKSMNSHPLDWNMDYIQLDDTGPEAVVGNEAAKCFVYKKKISILQQLSFTGQDDVDSKKEKVLKTKTDDNKQGGSEISLKPLEKIIDTVGKLKGNKQSKKKGNLYKSVKVKRLKCNPNRKKK